MNFKNHRGAVEPGALERLSKFFPASKQIMRRSRRKIDIYIGVRLDGVVDDFCVWAFARRRPDGETEFAAGFEDADRLGACPLGIGQMEQCEVGQDASETGAGKWQILRIAFAEFDVGKHFLR